MKATFGMGCFWKPDELFRKIKGVNKTEVGFMGGGTPNPSYMMVSIGTTGHAEVVHIDYDPKKISYKELLEIFWDNHNPTHHNRQGVDIGSQYCSVIFYHNLEQRKIATETMSLEQKKYDSKIATLIMPAKDFYKAEDYHQKYYMKNKGAVC